MKKRQLTLRKKSLFVFKNHLSGYNGGQTDPTSTIITSFPGARAAMPTVTIPTTTL